MPKPAAASSTTLSLLAAFEDSLPTPTNSLAEDLLRTLPSSQHQNSLVRDLDTPLPPLPPVKARVSAIEQFALKLHAKDASQQPQQSNNNNKKKRKPNYQDRQRGNQTKKQQRL
jgi:hypothetical protein